MRRTLARLAGLAATVALASAGLAAAAAPASAAEAGTGPRFYGVQLHSLWYDNTAADVTRQLDLLAATGANSARVDVAWSSLQTSGPSSWNSTYTGKIDALVEGAVARGLSLVMTLTETPCWASSAPATLVQDCAGAYWERGVTRYAPRDAADFARAAGWLAQRYGSRIAAVELWNEPNYVGTDGYSPFVAADRPAAYAALVKAAYPAVKAAAPGLPVLAGAMSFSDDVFLKALYAHGVQGSYDGVSVHPYNEWRAPGAPHDPTWYKYDYVMGLEKVRATMLAAGDSSPVWITEMGWTDCLLGYSRWCVTADQQATYLAAAATMTTRWPWVRAFLAYNLRDKGTDRTYTEDNFGLVRRDYTPKPALAALTTAFGALRAGSTVAPAPLTSEPVTTEPVTTAPTTTTTTTVTAPTTTVTAPTTTVTAPTTTTTTWSKPRAVQPGTWSKPRASRVMGTRLTSLRVVATR